MRFLLYLEKHSKAKYSRRASEDCRETADDGSLRVMKKWAHFAETYSNSTAGFYVESVDEPQRGSGLMCDVLLMAVSTQRIGVGSALMDQLRVSPHRPVGLMCPPALEAQGARRP